MRPTAWWIWVFFPPSAGLWPRCPGTPDHVLLRHDGPGSGAAGQRLPEERRAHGLRVNHQAPENVRVQAFEVSHDRKQQVLEGLLSREKGRCLVFARTKRGTERLAKTLIRQGFSAAMIHGDRSQSQRNAALAGFQRGSYRVLVATDVASRGIHVQDIAHVINYDMPADAESFIHRAGRTGRAGERGVASTLFARDQQRDLLQLERTLGLRMERMREHDDPRENAGAPSAPIYAGPRHSARAAIGGNRAHTTSENRMQKLPGEVFQAQLES